MQCLPLFFGVFAVVFDVFTNATNQADTKAVEVMSFNVCACFALTTTCFNRAVGVDDKVVADML